MPGPTIGPGIGGPATSRPRRRRRCDLLISLRSLTDITVHRRSLAALPMRLVAQGVDAGRIDPPVVEIEERTDGNGEIELLVRPASRPHAVEIPRRNGRRLVVHLVDEPEERPVTFVEAA